MNRIFFIFFIFFVLITAYFNVVKICAKNIKTAANTPAQVEMKPVFNNKTPYAKFEKTNAPQEQTPFKLRENGQIDNNIKPNEQNLKDFQQRRNNDIFK